MDIARGRLQQRVTEELADHWQGLHERQRAGREGMPQIVNSHIGYGGAFDPIEFDEARARFGMDNMVRRRRGPLASHRSGSRRRKR